MRILRRQRAECSVSARCARTDNSTRGGIAMDGSSKGRAVVPWICAAAMLAVAGGGSAWAQNNAKVSGNIGTQLTFPLGLPELPVFSYRDDIAFECDGYPTCTGTYTGTFETSFCTNRLTYSGGVTVTNLDLSRPGTSFQGVLLLKNRGWQLAGFDPSGKPANCS